MNEQRKRLLKKILKDYAEELSNNGCNDLPNEWISCMDKEEWDMLLKEFNEWNSKNKEDYLEHMPDLCVVDFLAEHLE